MRGICGCFPSVDNIAAITVTDFLGRGTACVLWSSPLPAYSERQLRYVDLMCGQKPHLLTRSVNNLGAETRIDYASSTKFYLADKAAGTPWVTRLPFPVHVVERVEVDDRVSRNRFVTRYSYHHGFYDGVEHEFRGFGRVDQIDTEEIAVLTASSHFPGRRQHRCRVSCSAGPYAHLVPHRCVSGRRTRLPAFGARVLPGGPPSQR